MEFHKLADVGRWGTAWQRGKDWSANTANGIAIGKIHSNAALRVLSSLGWVRHSAQETVGIDIGAGAGYISAGFEEVGIKMTASEWHDDGLFY